MPLKWSVIFLQSWTSIGYFPNSTGSFVTNCRFSPIINADILGSMVAVSGEILGIIGWDVSVFKVQLVKCWHLLVFLYKFKVYIYIYICVYLIPLKLSLMISHFRKVLNLNWLFFKTQAVLLYLAVGSPHSILDCHVYGRTGVDEPVEVIS